MYVHPTDAVTTAREPLGILDVWMWARELRDANGQRVGPKESLRWIEGYERLAELAPRLPATRLVYVADREADMLSLMVRAQQLACPVDWLVRAAHNRCLPDSEKLWPHGTEANRWARSNSPWQRGPEQRRASCVSTCGLAVSNCPPGKEKRSAPPVLSPASMARQRVSSRSNGAC
jgi:hypothetical protein